MTTDDLIDNPPRVQPSPPFAPIGHLPGTTRVGEDKPVIPYPKPEPPPFYRPYSHALYQADRHDKTAGDIESRVLRLQAAGATDPRDLEHMRKHVAALRDRAEGLRSGRYRIKVGKF